MGSRSAAWETGVPERVLQSRHDARGCEDREWKKACACFAYLEGTSESAEPKPRETFLELLGAAGAQIPNGSAIGWPWRTFLAFCAARRLELRVKAIKWGHGWISIPGKQIKTQRQTWRPVR